MDYSFLGAGNKNTVDLQSAGEREFTAVIAERAHRVRLIHAGEDRLVLEIDGARRTFYTARNKEKLHISSDGRQYILEKADSGDAFRTDTLGFGKETSVKTPMPGRIVKVFVKEGDVVEPGQPVFIIESMKMENEIRAMNRGRVKKVMAKAGDAVNHGDVVVEFFPEEEKEAETESRKEKD